jgi:hypothetical protein
MMIKGGIRIGGLGISGFDADAAAYFERAGVTDATAKGQINAFVKGIKDLGIYNSMVSWPLRSTQNAGTGTTAYSLGGWGTFNGTFAGSPTWVANGLSFTTSDSVSSDINSISDDFTLVFCASGTGTQTSFSQYFGIQGRTGTAGNQAEIQTPTTVQINLQMRNSGSAGFTSDSLDNPFYLSNPSPFAIISSSIKTSTSLMNIRNLNNATSASGTYVAGTATLNRMQLNGRWTGSAVQLQVAMTSSFCAIFTPSIDASLTSFYTLYKNTLGTGLGLP